MSKEKMASLTKYADSLKSRLSDKIVPEKQKNRTAQYKQFLERELSAVNSQIDAMKISGVVDAPAKK